MSQTAENKFNNSSAPNLDFSHGIKGKFTPDQTKERIKVHALAIATGYPTLQHICNGWKERFNIDITVSSEKEWRQTNRSKIEMKKHELIESGEIEIPVISDKVLADNLNILVTENCRLNGAIREKVTKLLKDLNIDELDNMTTVRLKNRLDTFRTLMIAFDNTNKAIVTSFDKMSTLAGKAKLVDAKAGHEEEQQRFLGSGDDEGFDPSAVEISDEDRTRLK